MSYYRHVALTLRHYYYFIFFDWVNLTVFFILTKRKKTRGKKFKKTQKKPVPKDKNRSRKKSLQSFSTLGS